MQRVMRFGIGAATTVLGLLAWGSWGLAEGRAQTVRSLNPQLSTINSLQAPALAGTWKIDPAHSNVNFAIRHMGINMIRGRFDTFAGTIVADPTDLAKSSVEVTIQAASIDTDIAARDNHLRNAEFLDVEKFPQITFKSTRVEKGEGGAFVARGTLTMHGVSRDLSLPFRVGGPVKDARAGSRVGFETQIRLNRQDYGIKYDQVLDGVIALANDVDITIGLEAIPAR